MAMRRYLKQRPGGGWAAKRSIPKHLQEKLGGKAEIVRGLGTSDLVEANKKKWKVLAEIDAEIAAMLEPNHSPVGDTQGVIEEALEEAKATYEDDDLKDILVSNRAEEIEAKHGLKVAQNYFGTATGRKLPVSLAARQWHAKRGTIRAETSARDEMVLNALLSGVMT